MENEKDYEAIMPHILAFINELKSREANSCYCHKCGFPLCLDRRALLTHLQYHASHEYYCHLCNYQFTSRRKMDEHMDRVHPGNSGTNLEVSRDEKDKALDYLKVSLSTSCISVVSKRFE